jgi:hypothetical protein
MDNFSKPYWEQIGKISSAQGKHPPFIPFIIYAPLLDVECITLRLLYSCPPENRGRGRCRKKRIAKVRLVAPAAQRDGPHHHHGRAKLPGTCPGTALIKHCAYLASIV